MCFDPITIGALTLGPMEILSAGAGIASAIGSISAGAQASSDSQQRAAIMEQQAAQEQELAELEARNLEKENNAFLGRARAVMSGGGGSANTGTALLLQAQNTRTARADERLVRAGGDIRATRLRQGAGFERLSGSRARGTSFFRAGSTLLATAQDTGRAGGLTIG